MFSQDQLPPSISPGFRDVVSGVVPLPQVAFHMLYRIDVGWQYAPTIRSYI